MVGVEIVNFAAKPNHLGALPADGELAQDIQVSFFFCCEKQPCLVFQNVRMSNAFQRLCFAQKMIIERGGRHGATVRFLSALNITKEEMDACLTIFCDSVRKAEAARKAK